MDRVVGLLGGGYLWARSQVVGFSDLLLWGDGACYAGAPSSPPCPCVGSSPTPFAATAS